MILRCNTHWYYEVAQELILNWKLWLPSDRLVSHLISSTAINEIQILVLSARLKNYTQIKCKLKFK